ncbi:OmpA family protein [Granulicella cerasi]|uniref:OmpA family protein n=1 Tax=Granulicella cerasi TaxID=741063 RepID=A0ABW1ZCG0_9BACT|nr:OmpA family protein [Granulicella cerasi]
MFSKAQRLTGVLSAAAVLAFVPFFANAQEANPTTIAPGAKQAAIVADGPNGMYIYKVKVVERDLDAVNYLNRSGSTKIGFQGTSLLPQATGEGKVDSVTGKTNIQVNFKGLKQANSFGPEYLTYVLWAISADGRPQNLGELELAGDKASLQVSSGFQSFGMIVTAEPYYAVSQPSDVVVLQNVFSDKTQGILQHVNIHYSLLPKGLYANTGGQNSVQDPITDREHYPLALYEAHNAARIALAAGAEKYAPGVVERMNTNLKNADDMQASKSRDVKMIFTQAREATQRAEDARLISLRKQAADRAQAERDARAAAEANAAASQQQAADSQAAADRAAAAKAEADAERAKAEAAAAAANAQAASAKQDAAATREKLRAQLNNVLQTSENARGLIVNMNDVLFDTGKYTLKPGTQVSLAKVATILQLYPGLKVHVEGYTDSVGGDDYNQKLSENRANAVKDFLTQNGVPADNVTSQGYGKTHPVADNGTKEGRAQNRRVNLVVSGDAIGVKESTPDQQ